jgi:hypothetical protein
VKAIGYLFLSTQDQVEDAVSLDAQEAKVRAWAELNHASEVVIFRDEGLSEKRLEDRPGLQAALNEVGKGDALVCYSLLCLAHQPDDPVISQSTMDMLAIASTLRRKRAKLVSLCEDAEEAIFRVHGSMFREIGFPVDEVPLIRKIRKECEALLLRCILFLSLAVGIIFVISGFCVNNPRLVVMGFVVLGPLTGLIWLVLHHGPSFRAGTRDAKHDTQGE